MLERKLREMWIFLIKQHEMWCIVRVYRFSQLLERNLCIFLKLNVSFYTKHVRTNYNITVDQTWQFSRMSKAVVTNTTIFHFENRDTTVNKLITPVAQTRSRNFMNAKNIISLEDSQLT